MIKTLDEATRLLNATQLMLLGKDNQPISDLYYALQITVDSIEELQERREADKWVNAKERKPEKDGVYLVVVEFQHILLVTYYDAENEHWGTANGVIAWRPLPEYKESEDK